MVTICAWCYGTRFDLELAMLEGVLELDEKCARDLMTPKARVVYLNIEDENLRLMAALAVLHQGRVLAQGGARPRVVAELLEKLLEEISFEGPDLKKKKVTIDAAYVRRAIGPGPDAASASAEATCQPSAGRRL